MPVVSAALVVSTITFVVSVTVVVESVLTVVVSGELLHDMATKPIAIATRNFFICLKF